MINKLLTTGKADISVHFSGGSETGRVPGIPTFRPGETVSGYVAFSQEENIAYKKLSVRVKWRTEGRGDTDESVWTTVEEADGTLVAGAIKTVPFSAVLPSEPWSFSGRYVAVVWGVDVEADVAWKINPRHFAPFILAPDWSASEV